MSPEKIRNAAMVGIIAIALTAVFIILAHSHGKVVIARERAEAAKPFVERKIAEGSKSYWRIPDSPATLTLELQAGQCLRFEEVDQEGRKVDWTAPYESRVLWYEITARNVRTGETRPLWPGRIYRAGDKVTNYTQQEELLIRVARVSGPATYLKLDMKWVPESFGIPGGPLGNARVP